MQTVPGEMTIVPNRGELPGLSRTTATEESMGKSRLTAVLVADLHPNGPEERGSLAGKPLRVLIKKARAKSTLDYTKNHKISIGMGLTLMTAEQRHPAIFP